MLILGLLGTYVLWCFGGICHHLLTFLQIGCGYTVVRDNSFIKAKFRKYFAWPSFCLFEWCGIKKSLFCCITCGKCGGKLVNSIFKTKIESFQVNWNWQPKPFCTKKAKDKSSASSQGRCLESFSRKILLFTFISFIIFFLSSNRITPFYLIRTNEILAL